ncbi:MAG TPA: hypothetical protein VFW45_14870 [Candidatus Polarisedimenticolia bacterium]|nr:hypothetical protein [Candidatus Polarisedimenticolia bacterium]
MSRAMISLVCAFLGLSITAAVPESSPEGPRYEYSSKNSPGVELKLKEMSREKRGKVTFVHYKLSATGFNPGKELSLYSWVWSTKNGNLSQSGFRVDDAGKVACPQPEPPKVSETPKTQCQAGLEENDINAIGFLAGQVYMLGLISPDGEQKGFVEVIPFPIEAEDRGCRLQAKRLSLNADTWLIEGDGFKPEEAIHYAFKGPGGSYEASAKLKETGKVAFTITPPDSGTLHGSVTVTVEASACKPVLRFKWGISAIEFP